MFSALWWKRALERAAKSAAQGFLLGVGTDAAGWLTLSWANVAIVTGGMAILSIATSIVTTPLGDDPEDPSAVS